MTLAELREVVAVMRELGVRRFGEIELDAPPRAAAAASSSRHWAGNASGYTSPHDVTVTTLTPASSRRT